MKTEQRHWTKEGGWVMVSSTKLDAAPQLVFAFGARAAIEDPDRFAELRKTYPDPATHILTCSTAGEILDRHVYDNSIAVTAVRFEKTTLHFATTDIRDASESHEAGKKLGAALPKENLVHTMVFAEGLKVNGTALVGGLNDALPETVSVTGGLVGDGADFKKTVVGFDAPPQTGKIAVIGFYGTAFKVGYGSLGGWDPFGLERVITKSKNNVLYELDGKPALSLYKEYLGDQAKGLPGTGLLFPLRLRVATDKGDVEVVRTILAVNESDQSLTFAGDMPEGAQAMLMKANFERLIDGASGAGSMSKEPLGSKPAELAILISCIGRKLVLKERIEEEIEAVSSAIGGATPFIGFYSYGELCPVAPTEKQCQLHNQTMTITTLREETSA